MDDGLFRVVAKAHVVHGHVPFDVGELQGPRGVGGLGLLVDEAEHPLGGSASGLQLADDVGHLVDGPGEPPGVQHKAGQIPQRQPPPQKQDGPEHADKGQGQVVDEVYRGACHAPVVVGVVVGVHRGLVPLVEAPHHGGLLVVGLGGLLPGDHLLHKAVELPQLYGPLVEQGPHFFRHVPGEQDGHGDGDGEHQHQQGGDEHHHQEGAHHRNGAGGDLQQVVGEGGVHRIDVVRDAGDDVPGLVGVEVPHRQLGQLVKELLAHLEDDLLAQVDHQNGQGVGQGGADQVEQAHQGAGPEHRWEVHLPRLCADGVYGHAGEHGPQQRQQVAHHRQGQGQQRHPLVGVEIAPQPPQHLLPVLGLFDRSSGSWRHVTFPPFPEKRLPAPPSGSSPAGLFPRQRAQAPGQPRRANWEQAQHCPPLPPGQQRVPPCFCPPQTQCANWVQAQPAGNCPPPG